MRILDIDLDFFVDPRPMQIEGKARLPSSEYEPWAPSKVEAFLTDRCKLYKELRLPGAVVKHHHELFERWKDLIEAGQLSTPFHLTHIDSHADMGMGFGDTSCMYIMGDLLHREVGERDHPKRGGPDGLLEGNFISFAIACRWVSSLVYVHHPTLRQQNDGIHDIPNCLFRDNEPNSDMIELKKLPPECQKGLRRPEKFEPLALEPPVSFELVDGPSFSTDEPFDFIFAAKSLRYTPVTADPILEIIRQYIDKG